MAITSNYALRLLTSLKTKAEKVAAAEGTTLNQFNQRGGSGEVGGTAHNALL